MKEKEIKLTIPSGIKFINDWVDPYGNKLIEPYVSTGRVVVDKQITGCGFTTYCLENDYHTIIVSPRICLIEDKVRQYNARDPYWCFFYDRKRSDDQLSNELTDYITNRQEMKRPMKLWVTMDSFVKFVDLLENVYHIDVNSCFRIANDESHCLITDVKMKENSIEPVIPRYLDRLFRYDNVLFISATPIIDFLSEIDQFKANPWNYLRLDWMDKTCVSYNKISCGGPRSAFKKIYDRYMATDNPKPSRAFDVSVRSDDTLILSTQAVIFLNSVRQIVNILDEFINKKNLINVADVTVICAKRPENQARLDAIPGLKYADHIPKEYEPHTTWTFVTATAFEGCDFKSPCASTYVIANYRVQNLAIDVSKDLHQIAGRQRLQANPFRDKMTIFYTQKVPISQESFDAMQAEKRIKSQEQIDLYQANAGTRYGVTALSNLKKIISKEPDDLYVRIANGVPTIEEHLVLAEKYCYSVMCSQKDIKLLNNVPQNYSYPVINLKNTLYQTIRLADRIRQTCVFLSTYPVYREEVFMMLSKWNYQDVAYYISRLPIDRLSACGYDPWKLAQEINAQDMNCLIGNEIMNRVIPGQRYSSKDIKNILKGVFKNLGIKKNAVATDLPNYVPCSSKKTGGKIVYTIN